MRFEGTVFLHVFNKLCLCSTDRDLLGVRKSITSAFSVRTFLSTSYPDRSQTPYIFIIFAYTI